MSTKKNKAQEICTFRSREEIGFPENPNEWKSSPALFSPDGETLSIMGHPVMEKWEEPYMEMLAKIATSKGGRILELGFGLGISARYIQENKINEHFIIEANQEVYKKAIQFGNNAIYPTKILYGLWQEVIENMPSNFFSGILFDTYPLDLQEVHCQHFSFFEHAYRILEEGGIFTYYSDEESDFSPNHLIELKKAGFLDIKSQICAVNPPIDCQYWTSKTILAPIITKA